MAGPDDLAVRRFMSVFRGNHRSYGEWDPNRPKGEDSRTIDGQYTNEQVHAHLTGKMGLGLVPVQDAGTCFWGAIDIDNHGSDKDIDIRGIEKKVAEMDMPLVACRSKSGGVHLYVFFSEPVSCDQVRQVLRRWATQLQVEGVDCIYPKQSRLSVNDEGQRQKGNWINLPYFDCGKDGKRFAVSNGKRLSFDGFLAKAEATAISSVDFTRIFGDDLSQLPPCLRSRLQSGGFSPGERNDGVFQVGVFCRKRDSEHAREMAHDLSIRFMPDGPISFKERDKTIRSALSTRANYKCGSFQDVCDRDTCRKLKWGISETEYNSLESRSKIPVFHSLVKYHNADPIRFELKIGDGEEARPIENITIDDLSNFSEFRKVVMARTHIVLPRLKNDEWDKILKELFDAVSVEEIPEDATPEGAVRARLVEFCRKADLRNDGNDKTAREALARGVPVVQMFEGVRVVMFRSVDFVTYLQRTKTDVIRNKDLWFKLSRSMGVFNSRVRVGHSVFPVWMLPVETVDEQEQHAHEFDPEY